VQILQQEFPVFMTVGGKIGNIHNIFKFITRATILVISNEFSLKAVGLNPGGDVSSG